MECATYNVRYNYIDTAKPMMRKAIEKRNCRQIEYLSKNVKYYRQSRCFEFMMKYYTEVFVGAMFTEDILEILLKFAPKCAPCFLYQSVLMDEKEIVKFILKRVKRSKLKKGVINEDLTLRSTAPLVVLATLNNSQEMLEILLDSKIVDPHRKFNVYNALTWAETFGFKSCSELLKNAGVALGITKLYKSPPIIALFAPQIDFTPETYITLITLLISRGYDVNSRTDYGISALYVVFNSQLNAKVKHCCIQTLLFKGADPFAGKSLCFDHNVISELLYANVDILKNDRHLSLIKQKLFEGKSTEIPFLLEYAHTVPPNDRQLLSTVHARSDIPKEVQCKIEIFLTKPKSLKHIAKNAIRKHYGVQLHQIMKMNYLPPPLKSYVLLEDCLEKFELLLN